MKRLLVGLILSWLISASPAMAEPWIVCDPQGDADGYSYSMDGGAWQDVNYQEGIKNNVVVALVAGTASLTIGVHSMSVKAFAYDPVWGRLESSAVPFEFTKPGSGSVLSEPAGIRIMDIP